MAQSVAVMKTPAAQPSNLAPTVIQDGMEEGNLPPQDGLAPRRPATDMMAGDDPAQEHRTEEDKINSNDVVQSMDPGKLLSPKDVNKDDSTLPLQETVANGDRNQKECITNSNLTSCLCPDKRLTRPVPPAKLQSSPKRPLTRAPPPKLPPKPPHLMYKRSPSSENLFARRKLQEVEAEVKVRSQSVSVSPTQQREESPERKLFKRPVPAPRKSLPCIYPDGLSLVTDKKNVDQTVSPEERSETALSTVEVDDSKPLPQMDQKQSVDKPDPPQSSNLAHSPRSEVQLVGEISDTATNSLKRKSAKARHVKVRERAAIFEKLIEEETRTRDSQISEPRSRTCSQSDYGEGAPKNTDGSDINLRGLSRLHSYVNVPLDGLLYKKAPLEDDMISVSSMSSDCFFDSPQSSVRIPPLCSPSPVLTEGEDSSEKISGMESVDTDVVLPGATPSVEPDSPNSTLELSPRPPPISPSTSEDRENSFVRSSSRDFDYEDVVIPNPSASHEAVSPRSTLLNNKLRPQLPKPRVMKQEKETSTVSADKEENALELTKPKQSFGVNAYRNVTPMFNLPPKPVALRGKRKGIESGGRKTRPATLMEKSKDHEGQQNFPANNYKPVDQQKRPGITPDRSQSMGSDSLNQKLASKVEENSHFGQQKQPAAPPQESTDLVAGYHNGPVSPRDIDLESVNESLSETDALRYEETTHHPEGTDVILSDQSGTTNTAILETHSIADVSTQQQLPDEELSVGKHTDALDMPPENLRKERSKTHPGSYEVFLPKFIDPVSLTRRITEVVETEDGKSEEIEEGNNDAFSLTGRSSEVVETGKSEEIEEANVDEFSLTERSTEAVETENGKSEEVEDTNIRENEEPSNTDSTSESEVTDMLCNVSRRQRLAVRRDTNRYSGTYSRKWQHESAPAKLGGLERQDAVVEPSKDVLSPTAVSNRLSQASSAGSTISSLIDNVSVDDDEEFSSSDDEAYVNVPVPSKNHSIDIPPLPLSTDNEEDGGGTSKEENLRQELEDVVEGDGEDECIYSNLAACRSGRRDSYEDVQLPQGSQRLPGPQEEGNEDNLEEEERDKAPVEIEMQVMRSRTLHGSEKEHRRKAFEFHMPLFLRNSSSVESNHSVSHNNDRSEHSQGTLTEDSDSSCDFLDVIPNLPDSNHQKVDKRDSNTSCEQSDDGWSAESSPRVSKESSSVQSDLRNYLRIRRKSSEHGRPASSVSTDYDRPVSCASTDYHRPVSSTSADYIGVLNSFHEDGVKEDGFSFTWTVNPNEESEKDDSYQPKSEEVNERPPSFYDAPRASIGSAPPLPTSRALKPPKVPRPFSEPNRKLKRNSLTHVKNLPIPSKEEITEQLCKISRQRSRFVTQEPLFQLYQEDARSRDSYLRLMNISSLESLTTFLEKQEALKKEKRNSQSLPNPIHAPEYHVLDPQQEIYNYQTGEEELKNEQKKKQFPTGENFEPEDIYQTAEPVYEPPGELFYDTGNLLQNNAIYESGSLGSSTGEGSGGSGSDVEIPKPYGLLQRGAGSGAVRRSYWSELPEVMNSGLLEQMTPEEKRLQEALFEVITSEASYLRSLNLVVEHFSEAITLQPPTGLLNKVQHHRLFSNIRSVRDASEKLLLDLEDRQQDNIIISDMCDILLQHFDKGGFNSYIVYCANNQYQIKTLEELKKNPSFVEVLRFLESSPACCSLDLQSFLMLPFQRITRLPLLLEAIRQQAKLESPLHKTAMDALKALRRMAEQCNEEAKRMELIEEVTQLANQLDFREGVKKMNLSQTTSIVKRGRIHVIKKENKLLNRGRLVAKSIQVIVFTDKVVICKEKMKGEQLKYEVYDWCPRNLVHIEAVNNPQSHNKLPDGVPSTCKHVFIMSFLQNNQKKEVEFALDANSEAEKERWMDAMHPAKRTQDGETIYESWDCPQVICKQPYQAQDRDELRLDVYDRVDIDKKIEGWYYGTRVGDNAKGWFPASYTQEIVNDHVLARNLKQRHRLLSLCDQRLRHGKIMKK
ncbi:uncharacterized protein [Asterias amurensis]|uniref:uncharacterized protein n=1 Tax=Asterias amurensis TaxID=7602 RepID=UPI003AB6766B